MKSGFKPKFVSDIVTKQVSWPVPELIGGEDWEIAVGGGTTDSRRPRMTVPIDATLDAVSVRAHEMCHAAFTPLIAAADIHTKLKISVLAVQSAEDYRVNAVGAAHGVTFYSYDRGAPGFSKVLAEVLSMCDPAVGRRFIAYAACSLAAFPKATQDLYFGALAPEYREVVETVRRVAAEICDSLGHQFDATVALASWLDATFGQDDGTLQGILNRGEGAEMTRDGMFAGETWAPGDGYERDDDGPCDSPFPLLSEEWWGKMRIIMPDRPKAVVQVGERRSQRHRPLDEGILPARMYRMTIDQRVFTRRHGLRGGTILLDRSGSMCVKADDLKKLVLEFPRVTVADYGGHNREGNLRLLIRHGRRVSDTTLARPPAGSFNVIDVPALEWLGRQSAPRVWISDGGVTGVGDTPSMLVVQQAHYLKLRGRIRRYSSLSAFFQAVEANPRIFETAAGGQLTL